MRAIGTAERALEMMCRRANEREAFGGPLADKQFVQESIAASRMEIDQARLLTLYAAWKMDTEGKRAARQSISAIKVVAANIVMNVLDRAIQVHGSLGMTDDTPLAALWRFSRMLRLADGPDEVHKMVLARRELNRWAKRAEAETSGELDLKARPARDLSHSLKRAVESRYAAPTCAGRGHCTCDRRTLARVRLERRRRYLAGATARPAKRHVEPAKTLRSGRNKQATGVRGNVAGIVAQKCQPHRRRAADLATAQAASTSSSYRGCRSGERSQESAEKPSTRKL